MSNLNHGRTPSKRTCGNLWTTRQLLQATIHEGSASVVPLDRIYVHIDLTFLARWRGLANPCNIIVLAEDRLPFGICSALSVCLFHNFLSPREASPAASSLGLCDLWYRQWARGCVARALAAQEEATSTETVSSILHSSLYLYCSAKFSRMPIDC